MGERTRRIICRNWSAKYTAWLAEKKVEECLSREERVTLVDWQREELAVSTQAALLSLNRSSLYYQPVPPSAEEVALKHRIDQLYTGSAYPKVN